MNQEMRHAPSPGRYVLAAIGYLIAAAVGLFIGALLMILIVSAVSGVSPGTLLTGTLSTKATQRVTITPLNLKEEPVVAVVKKLGPSIVTITTKTGSTSVFGSNEAEGSGIIYRTDGYIVTNNHVIDGATSITVSIGSDDVAATVVGADKDTDLAVIKVNRTNLPVATFADSGKLNVGQTAIAIGSPFGFQGSVTSGVVSALHRNVSASDTGTTGTTYTDLVQTDAAINPGNSGGALADRNGNVIGITSLIFSPSGSSAGLGFAIPSNTVKTIADQLISKGSVQHAYMGILGQTVNPDLAKQLGLSVNEGAVMQEIIKGGPAEAAGLQRNDVITKFDGTTITSMDDLVGAIRTKNPGDKVTITYMRGKETKTTEVTLGTKP